MKKHIYIFGHKNPDTDSICSALAYAEFKKKMGVNAKAFRLGDINNETKYVLNYFKIQEPDYLDSVKPQLEDVELIQVGFFTPEMPLKSAWEIMSKNNLSIIPIINEDKTLVGIISKVDIIQTYFKHKYKELLRECDTNFKNILDVLDGKIVVGKYKYKKIQGMVHCASQILDDEKLEASDIILVGKNKTLQKIAILSGAGCVILTGNEKLTSELKKIATKKNCTIVISPHSYYESMNQINLIMPIKAVMKTENLEFFYNYEYLDVVKRKMSGLNHRQFPILDAENKLLGTISINLLSNYTKKKVILVDHNERGQSANGIEMAEIIETIDHHRIDDIHTEKPVLFSCEPVGSTSTIVAEMYFKNGIPIETNIAGILMAAILSDTLLLKSPTCTEKDKKLVRILSEIVNVAPESFGKEMIIQGTSLDGKTEADIFHSDLKVYQFGDFKAAISQINTGDHKSLINRKQKIREYMAKECKENNYDFAILMITDIIEIGSELIFVGNHKYIFDHAFKKNPDSDYIFLPNVVSRKKQIVPSLEHSASL